MKRLNRFLLGLHLVAGLLFGTISPAALACPDCQYEVCLFGACACVPKSGCIVGPHLPDPGKLTEQLKTDPIGAVINPLGTYNPTGIPQLADVVEFSIKHPDQLFEMASDPGKIAYAPVIAAIIAGRNAVIASNGRPIPEHIKPFLLRWHTPELIDSVRWTSNWGPLNQTLQAAQMRFNHNTRAIALLNAVVFRDAAAANDPALWAHEMVHIQQYRDWGVADFARTWVNDSSDGGPVESPAYRRGEEANAALNDAGNGNHANSMITQASASQKFPSGFMLGQCGCWGAVNANAMVPAPMCASGMEGPVACGPMGPCGGGAPWVRACK